MHTSSTLTLTACSTDHYQLGHHMLDLIHISILHSLMYSWWLSIPVHLYTAANIAIPLILCSFAITCLFIYFIFLIIVVLWHEILLSCRHVSVFQRWYIVLNDFLWTVAMSKQLHYSVTLGSVTVWVQML